MDLTSDLLFFLKTQLPMYLGDSIYIKFLLGPLLVSFISYFSVYLKNIYYYIANYDDFLEDFLYSSKAQIDFEVCLLRQNHCLRVESDDGYHSLRHYIFNQPDQIKGLRLFRKIPQAKTNKNNSDLYDDYIKNPNKEYSDGYIRDLYLTKNNLTLPNGLLVKSKLIVSRKSDENKPFHQEVEKFYFRLKLVCCKFNNQKKNLNHLLKEYNQMLKNYQSYINSKFDQYQFSYFYDNHQNEDPYFNKLFIGNEYKSFNSIFFKQKTKLLSDLDFFVNNKDYYTEKGKPYRNIILSYGEPGCGKTSIIQGILNLLDKKYNQKRHLIHLDLNKLNKKDLQSILFSEYLNVNDEEDGRVRIPFEKRIYYIEEIDGYDSFQSRDNDNLKDDNDLDFEKIHKEIKENKIDASEMKKITKTSNYKKPKLSVQDLLELLDGPISIKSGEIFIMTTNYIDKIDKAILRPGRINHLIYLEKSRLIDIRDILNFYFDENISIEKLKEFKDYQLTPAFISETCNFSRSINECLDNLKKNLKTTAHSK